VPNRLARERSPYLLQHANNPVEWHPWGDEAFAEARRRDVPIFLSIGYSTCHWCHVMEHESFEDANAADVLNRLFVPIKVDREERPDVDRVYMTFVQATTGAGGWPMSVWLTPELKPFFGGTYFPPTGRWGRPGFVDVLTEIGRAWRDEREKVLKSAETITERLRDVTGSSGGGPLVRSGVAGREAIAMGVNAFAQSFDQRHGGFGQAPKFPRPSELLFLLNAHALSGDARAKTMTLDTLRAMAMGGMRDHIGGGFHRYSVDGEWRVPHFEKMLYDQAQLVLAYLEASQASGDPFYAAVAEDTLDYVVRDMTDARGGFYSAEDADSVSPAHGGEKREGAFYVWAADEIDALMADDAPIIRKRFGIEEGGNALADPQGEFTGMNLLYIAQSIEDVAARTGRDVEAVMRALRRARRVMFDARATRPRPHLDDKVIAAWNGLMIAAMARAARQLVDSPRRSEWRHAAIRAATFVRDTLWREADRRLLRRYRDGDAAIDGFCEDYACVAWGAIELFQTTGDAQWLDWAGALTQAEVALFFDEADAGWFSTTGHDPSVLLRMKEDYDGAEPSAASVTVRNLIRLSQLGGTSVAGGLQPAGAGAAEDPLSLAGRSLERYGPAIAQAARVMPLMLANVALWHGRRSEIVIAGSSDSEDRPALERVVFERYLPFAVTVSLDAGAELPLPWLASMTMRDGKATAYVCEQFTCRAPVTGAAALAAQLDGDRY
jgi:uncharacterized protein YyaL (SSP411 family)